MGVGVMMYDVNFNMVLSGMRTTHVFYDTALMPSI